MKKIILFGIVVLCLLFSGCGKQDNEKSTLNAQTMYVANTCSVPNLQGTINSTLKIGTELYAGVYTKGTAVEDGRYCVVTYDISDGTNERTILRGKEEMVMWSFTVLEDGNYKALFFVWNAENENYSSMCLLTFDRQGNVIEEQELTQKVKDGVPDTIVMNSFCLDRTGDLYFYTTTYEGTSITSKIYCVGNSGDVQLIKEYSGAVLELAAVSSKVWAVVCDRSDNISIYDVSNQDEEDNPDLNLGVKVQNFTISDGLTDEQKFIVQDANVYEYNLNSQELVHLFAYEDVGLEAGIINTGKLIAAGPDEFYVLKKTEETEDGIRKYDWVRLTKSDEVLQKEILTIAVLEESTSLKEAITAFNKSSEQYKAVVNVYAKDDKNSAATLLQADIAAGNIPDMIAVDMIDLDAMISKGLIHDLSDLLESDSELSENDFVGRSLEIYARGDKLYALPQSLCISAFTGKQKLLDGREKWNLKEFEEYVYSLPDQEAATAGISKDLMLQIVMEQYLSHFVDWENKQCTFESEEFAELLQFVNMYPDTYSDEVLAAENNMEKLLELFRSDEIILYPSAISDASDPQMMKYIWGEEIVYIGYPSAEGNGIQLMDMDTAYVITENSAHKEVMWQIIKYMVTNPKLAERGLAAYRPLFDKACETAMEKNMVEAADGSLVEKPVLELELAGAELDIFASTEEDIAMIKELFEKAEPVKASSSVIKNIIREEAWGYFSGQKEIDDVTGVIQSRVSVYLEE